MKPTAFCLALLFLLGGCATIISGGNSTLNIRTDPKGADVVITDRKGKEVFRGTSPASVRLNNGGGYFTKAEYLVRLSAPGFSEKTVPVTFKFNGWYVGNLFFGGLIGLLAVEPATGAMWKIVDPLVDEQLSRSGTTRAPELRIIDVGSLTDAQRAALERIN